MITLFAASGASGVPPAGGCCAVGPRPVTEDGEQPGTGDDADERTVVVGDGDRDSLREQGVNSSMIGVSGTVAGAVASTSLLGTQPSPSAVVRPAPRPARP